MPKREIRMCQTCGKPFTAELKASRPTWGRYCSMTCRNAAFKGKGNPNWRGGEPAHVKGYRYVHAPDHPAANAQGLVLKHRVVAEQMLGRPLLPTEDVHHRNSIRDDNRPENLEVIDHRDHSRKHVRRLKRDARGWWLKPEQAEAMPVQIALDLPEWSNVLGECS